jgi:HAD superfamily hydrolase (TIGR01509 family)
MSASAVIFDVDGTLVDSNDAHACAWTETLREFGIVRDVAEVRRLIGMGSDRLLPKLTGISADSEQGQRIIEARGRHFRDAYLPHLRPFPGTRPLLERLAKEGLRLGVASSAKKDELSRLLEIADVHDLVEWRTTSDDVESSKPDPDIVQTTLRRMAVPPDAARMVGDTPYDIEAARRAGVKSIAFRCGGWSDDDLAGAIVIYDGPAAMLADYPWRAWR